VRLRAAPLVVTAALLVAPGAAPAAILEPGDADELANQLAEATEQQGVCYGWVIRVSDPTGVEDGDEIGSNRGPGQSVANQTACDKFVVLEAGVSYASEYSESEDDAAWRIDSNLAKPPTVQDLTDLGYEANDLLGDDNDLAILNATGALPAIVAERGEAEAVPFETERRAAGVGGEPTGDTGNDFLRENGTLLGLCALLMVGGLAWLLAIERQRRRRHWTP
jgi:hypothetical protein